MANLTAEDTGPTGLSLQPSVSSEDSALCSSHRGGRNPHRHGQPYELKPVVYQRFGVHPERHWRVGVTGNGQRQRGLRGTLYYNMFIRGSAFGRASLLISQAHSRGGRVAAH
jgi:hypothetical protein